MRRTYPSFLKKSSKTSQRRCMAAWLLWSTITWRTRSVITCKIYVRESIQSYKSRWKTIRNWLSIWRLRTHIRRRSCESNMLWKDRRVLKGNLLTSWGNTRHMNKWAFTSSRGSNRKSVVFHFMLGMKR